MEILEHYFLLADSAGEDAQSFWELCNLFAANAVIKTDGGETYSGREAIASFYKNFFDTNPTVRHLWDIQKTSTGFKTNWALICRSIAGIYSAQTGRHLVEIKDGKITYLQIISH
ncbi:nuclear transport factor 2 family protein [Streptococcus dentasini]